MDQTTAIPSTTGNDSLAVTRNPNSGSVRVHYQHVDDFDGDEDYWVTLGEFKAADIIAALLPPKPAAKHVAEGAPPQTRRRAPWRRK